ncbi:methyltransferase domain-containing protein [Algihabitans albus]|uniref:methyltransferase domain-containing protein n=1 Tax=Algihabitans albus TaxID=2164067 RepID=UPI000E5C90DC|nr:methyltransferase domain-containing protein [Algihabitans albus]
MTDTMQVFDRAAVRAHRERSAARWPDHDFLKREVATRLLDRLRDVNRDFASALDLGCHGGTLAELLPSIGKVERLVQCDVAPAMARRASTAGWPALAADEEALPFAPRSFDLALSVLNLHWVNDLPGSLLQLNRCLKPDGLFLGALLGGESLHELRVALMEAELELTGGLSPRISPFAEVRDCGGLLQRAGFALPVVDQDEITVTYADPFSLLRELRGMAETNAVRERRRGLASRALFARMAEVYAERFARPDGRIPITFQVLYLTAWAPHETQQQPLRPGSAKTRLAEALNTVEKPAGDKANPGTKAGS